MEEKYIAAMVLHAVGDTIGFKNGEWEFKKGGEERSLEKLYEFIELGGVNGINLKGWNVSDDTVLNMKTAEALLTDFTSLNTYGITLKEKFIEAEKMFAKEGYDKRYIGKTTLDAILAMEKGKEWNEATYDESSGGSGASMRAIPIGLAYYGKENRYKLIQMAIESSRVTHNYVIGYLGGLAAALFIALAIEGVHIHNWPFILMELFDDNTITKYISTSQRGYNTYMRDAHLFIDKWKIYIDDKFDQDGKPIKKRSDKNIIMRGRYYRSAFGYKVVQTRTMLQPNVEGLESGIGQIGSAGHDSVIIAYDALLDAGKNWEKLVVYSMLHMGDTDTTGCIAAAMYGALYGFEGVPENFIKNLEFKTEIEKLGKNLYKKFYKN